MVLSISGDRRRRGIGNVPHDRRDRQAFLRNAGAQLTAVELLDRPDPQPPIPPVLPLDRPYDIVHRNLYTIHQRVAAEFRKGRVLLAGDSAHVNNSIGGMGLNGGLQDAANLAEKLGSVILDNAPDSELDLYDKQRRTVTHEFVQAQTIANKKRLEARDPELRKQNLNELSETAADPDKAREFLRRTAMLTMQKRAAAITLEDA